MNHQNNFNNNNINSQDERGDKLGKRSVLADWDWDGPSQPHKTTQFPSTQFSYGVDVNQERSSCSQLGSNFTQDMQMASSFRQINPTDNSNLIHDWGSPLDVSQHVFGSSQIPISEPNAENSRNNGLVEFGYGDDVNQERYSCNQLGSNFTQDMQMAASFRKINLSDNSNLIHAWGSPLDVSQHAFGSSQIPRSEPKGENSRNNGAVESRKQGKKPEGFKHCSCQKSRCLNLYCECFAKKKFCVNCQCKNCQNTSANAESVAAAQKRSLHFNPTAFDPKIIGDKHTQGCDCKRTSCTKRYCRCNANNVKCTKKCRCVNCQNPVGAKDYGEITVPGEISTQSEQDNTAANVPVGQQKLSQQQPVQGPIQSPNYGSLGNTESQLKRHACHATLPAYLGKFQASQPQHFPSNSYHPSINDRVDSDSVKGSEGFPNLHYSMFNNNRIRSSPLTNESSETNHGTLPVDVHANETLGTQQLTASAENLSYDSSATSNNRNSNSNSNNNKNNNNNNNSNKG
ncbi:Lin-54 family protein [Dioscorea alata]|uniref:Lin-54 family protein n=1 Tax=Dioscorea alata TaxID=55571 RepID=A0ACB7WFN0_DIOAL|nr:Lin-54 family protein [Dioscorea alata]